MRGVFEAGAGLVGDLVGGALDATGVGAIAGVPINVVSTAAVIHGSVTSVTGATNLGKDAANAISNNNSGNEPSGLKAKDAPEVTAGGQATDEHGNKLGPSGKPQVNETNSNTREGARNKSLNEGSTAVE